MLPHLTSENVSGRDTSGAIDPPDGSSLEEEELAKAIPHHCSRAVITFPSVLQQIPIQRTLTPDVPVHADGGFRFEYAEHTWLGDALPLQWHDGTTRIAKEIPFTLPNGLRLTYGTINALAGDFYATKDPICEAPTLFMRQTQFRQTFDFLAVNPQTPAEANDLLKLLQQEINAVNEAVREGRSVPEAYYNLPDMTTEIMKIMANHGRSLGSGQTYLELARCNFDHFGDGARMAYDAGHSLALQVAIQGTPEALEQAYTMNAFADHFLEDLFAAGHLRTPRKALHGWGFGDICAKYMHDEDNALGLRVSNALGETWTVYGDKKLLTEDDAENQKHCHRALMASADEVYQAWHSRTTIPVGQFRAWDQAPIPLAEQKHQPLFNYKAEVRSPLSNRQSTKYDYVLDWVGLTAKLSAAPEFKEPIHF